jgi:hypothetical protein
MSRVADALETLGFGPSVMAPEKAAEAVLADAEKTAQFIALIKSQDWVHAEMEGAKDRHGNMLPDELNARYKTVAERELKKFLQQPASDDPEPDASTTESPDEGKEDSMATKTKGKKAAKAKTKKANGGAGAIRKVGVIDVIKHELCKERGASTTEIHAKLVEKFPDRDPEGMLSTVRVQVNRLAKALKITKERDEKRGLVYYGKDSGK